MFASLKVVIEGSTDKQKLQKLIKAHGGEVCAILNDKVNVVVSTDKFYSYKIRNAQKLNLAIVSADYIFDSVEFNELQETDDYIIPFPKDEQKHSQNVVTYETTAKAEAPQQDVIARYDMNDKNSRLPYFPTEYEIIKSDTLEKGDHFCVLELHVAGVGLCEVSITGRKSGDERTYFRVFLHHGSFRNRANAALECIPAESLYTAEETYIKIYKEYESNRYSNPYLTAVNNIGSEKAREASFLSLEGKLPEKVKELVVTLYNEATSYLCDILSSNDGLAVDPHGKITTPFGKLSIDQIELGESLLLQIHRLLKDAKGNDNHIGTLVKEFHNLIPTCRTSVASAANLQELLIKDLDDLQHMKDILYICEGLGAQQSSMDDISAIDAKYQAIGCQIRHITESQEYTDMVTAIETSMQCEGKIQVNNIYALKRTDDRETFSAYTTNQKLLFHPSTPGAVLGLLSRGSLPTIAGNLGSGIYFVSDAAASAKLSPPKGQSGKRFMLASNVALGIIRKFTSAQPSLTSAPEGFDCVQGLKTGERQTEFTDDEFVVYNTNQCYLSYLIEFTSEIGDEPQCEKCNAAKPTTLKVLPQYSYELHIENLPTILPPLPTAAPVRKGGLLISNSETQQFSHVPLIATHVNVKIVDLISEVTVLQYYKTLPTMDDAGTFVLPLDANTSVCGLECFINNNRVLFKMEPREPSAKKAGQKPEDSQELFNVNVGLLPPSATVIIALKYVSELATDGDDICFSFPSFLTPTSEDIDKNSSDPLIGFSIQVSIEMPHDIAGLVSPTHEIHTKRMHTHATVELAGTHQRLLSDFTLRIALEEAHQPRMWLEEDESGHFTSMLTFNPRFEQQSYRETELLFVIDGSCSMQSSLPEVQRILRALISCLQTTTAQIKFNIITFARGSTHLFLSSELVSESTLKSAWQYVNNLKLHYGSTNIYAPLHSICLRAFLTQTPTSVFLFTDGHTNQPDKLAQLVRQNSARVRLFPIGIGPSPSRHYVQVLAEAGNGIHDFVGPNQIPNPEKVAELLKCSIRPASSIFVQFDTSNKAFIQVPAKICPVFPGHTRIVYAFAGKCTHANVKIMTAGRVIESSIHVRETSYVKGSLLHCMFVRTLMKDQHEGLISSVAHVDDAEKRRFVNEIMILSAKYFMESRFTRLAVSEYEELAYPPILNDMVEKGRADKLRYMAWKEVEEARLATEIQREAERSREDLLESAARSRARQNYRDFADSMYKVAKMKMGINLQELRQLGIATKSVVKPILMELKEEGEKLILSGKITESIKFKRARSAIQQEITRFEQILDNEVEPFLTSEDDKTYFYILKKRCDKVLERAGLSLDQIALNMMKRKKKKSKRRHKHEKYHFVFGVEDEGNDEEEAGEEDGAGAEEESDSSSEEEVEGDGYNVDGEVRSTTSSKAKVTIPQDPELEKIYNSVHNSTPDISLPQNNNPNGSVFHHHVRACTHQGKDAAEGADGANPTAGPNGEHESANKTDAAHAKEADKPADDDNALLGIDEKAGPVTGKGKKKGADDVRKQLRILIKNNILLRRLKPQHIIPLAASMTRKPVRAGRVVVREGEKGDYCYLVEEGTLDVMRKYEGRPDVKISTLEAGSIFGEVALWFNCNRIASVRTRTECMLWMVRKEEFLQATLHLRDQFSLQALTGVEFFSTLTNYERAVIKFIGQVRKYDSNFLFKEGEVLTEFYVLLSGSLDGAKGTKKATGGFELQKYHGYKSLTTDRPSKFSVKAVGFAEVLLIGKQAFLDYVVPTMHGAGIKFECDT